MIKSLKLKMDNSTSTALIVVFFTFFLLMYVAGVFVPVDWIRDNAQLAWPYLNEIFIPFVGLYVVRRGTEAWERIRAGDSKAKVMKEEGLNEMNLALGNENKDVDND